MCLGTGSCTRMPWIFGSLFSAAILASSSASGVSADITMCSECRPSSAQAFTLFATYTLEAGSSPTMMTANPGVMPRAFSASARIFHSARTSCAIVLPSMILAVMAPPSVVASFQAVVRSNGWMRCAYPPCMIVVIVLKWNNHLLEAGFVGAALVVGDTQHDLLAGFFYAFPAADLHPLVRFQILVVREEMLDLLQDDGG